MRSFSSTGPENSQFFFSFRLGHSIQGKSKSWNKRYATPFSPKDKDEASRIVREIFNSSGLPPVEYILSILNKEGGPDITLSKVSELKPDKEKRKIYENLETLIIDEVSMVKGDLFDCVEAFLSKWGPFPERPFGGVQLILIGDIHQLPPVVTSRQKGVFPLLYDTPYFFSSRPFRENQIEFIEFEKIYRQRDA